MDLTETNAAELLQDVINRFKKNPQFANVDLQFPSSVQPLFCRLDPRWMSRAIENLLMNAFLHNPPGTKATVSVTGEERDEHSGITIEIKDNGRGMDDETVSRLFERYYRGSNTMAESADSGLGMAIARQIILAHGGLPTTSIPSSA
jgi:signal transduction histidine kinase